MGANSSSSEAQAAASPTMVFAQIDLLRFAKETETLKIIFRIWTANPKWKALKKKTAPKGDGDFRHILFCSTLCPAHTRATPSTLILAFSPQWPCQKTFFCLLSKSHSLWRDVAAKQQVRSKSYLNTFILVNNHWGICQQQGVLFWK